MQATTSFTTAHQVAIETLRRDLTQRTQRSIVTEYGSTDCGQHWAALCLGTLPPDSDIPGPLVSILTGSGVAGDAAVMAFDGSTVADGATFPEALKAARFAGMQAWRAMKWRCVMAGQPGL